MYKGSRIDYNLGMCSSGAIDTILTGLQLGVPLEDMFILAELSPPEMEEFRKDELLMARANSATKKLTYDLLADLHEVIKVQKDKGKDHAITWLLERTNPVFTGNGEGGEKPGVINIFTTNTELKNSDTVEIHNA